MIAAIFLMMKILKNYGRAFSSHRFDTNFNILLMSFLYLIWVLDFNVQALVHVNEPTNDVEANKL